MHAFMSLNISCYKEKDDSVGVSMVFLATYAWALQHFTAQTRKMAEEYSGEVMRRAKSSGSTRRIVKMSNEFLQVDRDEIEEVMYQC